MVVGGLLLVVIGVLEVTGDWNHTMIHLREISPGYSEPRCEPADPIDRAIDRPRELRREHR